MPSTRHDLRPDWRGALVPADAGPVRIGANGRRAVVDLRAVAGHYGRAACVANAARCRRRHCYLTEPVFLAAAGLSVLRGAFHAGPSWNWISGVVILGWLLGWSLEQVFGSYVGRYS